MSDKPPIIDPELKKWAAPRQAEYIDAINKAGSVDAGARALEMDARNIRRGLQSVKARAARNGYAPGHFTAGIAPGYRMGKVTVHRHLGVVTDTWERQHPDQADMEAMLRDYVDYLTEEARGLLPPTPAPDALTADLLACYLFGDPHFGMKASRDEGADDFDLSEADRLTRTGIDRLTAAMPSTEEALLIVIGDNTHANDSSHKTPGHGNPLDLDAGGHNQSMLISAKAWAYTCRRLLEKHLRVRLWFMPGNHDPDAAFALALCLSMYFENEPRIEIDLTRGLYRCVRFGKVLIGAHHGHGAKQADLPLLMAVDNPVDWGLSEVRYVYQGHIHHDSVKEVQGVRVESIRTLAGKDAWHAGKGYRSLRDTRGIVHHKDYGEIERHTVSAAMLTQ